MKFLRNFLKFKKQIGNQKPKAGPIWASNQSPITYPIPDSLYTVSLYKHLDSNLNDDVKDILITKDKIKFIIKINYINESSLTLTLDVDHNNEVNFIESCFKGEVISMQQNGFLLTEYEQNKIVFNLIEDFLHLIPFAQNKTGRSYRDIN